MQTLAIQLAFNGAAVLLVSLLAGLLLYRAILFNGREAAWHLVHSGGSARGIMLMALAAIIHLPALPAWQLATIAGLIIFFAWTSMLAMLIAAATATRQSVAATIAVVATSVQRAVIGTSAAPRC